MAQFDERKALIYRVCELFFKEDKKVSEIAVRINQEFGCHLKRESIYPLLAQGREHGFVRLVPPLDEQMPALLAERFHHDPNSVKVVDLCGTSAADTVAMQTAEVVLSLVKRVLCAGRKSVALGLGPGRATLEVCRDMANLMRADPELPNGCLRLHAITGGGPAKHPEFAPISFFNLFPTRFVAECNGLFSETLVTVQEFKRLIKRADISQAFEQRKEIDVVVTSRGAVDDEHDLYTTLLNAEKVTLGNLKAKRWLGNVQYRPYTAEGPAVEGPNDLRAVTLFELSDFVEMAQRRDKHVVLIARSCSKCHNPQAEALRPLLTVPELKVWSHLVMDVAVAQAILNEDTVRQPEEEGRNQSL